MTPKGYTDIEQSKKLAEILPLESADMGWCNNSIRGVNYTDMQECFDKALNGWDKYWELIPCWSLTALLRELPDIMLGKDKAGYVVMAETMGSGLTTFASNPIDACYEMILKLHELKML